MGSFTFRDRFWEQDGLTLEFVRSNDQRFGDIELHKNGKTLLKLEGSAALQLGLMLVQASTTTRTPFAIAVRGAQSLYPRKDEVVEC